MPKEVWFLGGWYSTSSCPDCGAPIFFRFNEEGMEVHRTCATNCQLREESDADSK